MTPGMAFQPDDDPFDNDVTPASEYGDLELRRENGKQFCADCDVEVIEKQAEFVCPECDEYAAF